MLARIRKSAENKDSGFTLIELLVVMIIIGILAAIAIPAFLSQKKKAKETSAKADVSTIGKEIAAYYVDGLGTLAITPTGTVNTAPTWTLTSTEPTGSAATPTVTTGKLSTGNAASGSGTDAEHFCASVVNKDTTTPWKYTQDGLTQGSCS